MAKKILIVDDEADVVAFLRSLLEDNGYETCTAEDGDAALEVLEREHPDLITLDLMMPKITGTRFYRKLQQKREFQDTPVIVVSALAGRNVAVSHPFAVVDKPIDKEELLRAIDSALAQKC